MNFLAGRRSVGKHDQSPVADKIGHPLRFSANGHRRTAERAGAKLRYSGSGNTKSISARSRLTMPRLNSGELLLPFPGELFAGLVTHLTDGRKTVAPLIGSHGFDDHARVVTFLTLLNDRIEGAAPGTTQNINRGRRIGTRGYGQKNRIQIRNVNSFIKNDHISIQISAGMRLTRIRTACI